MIQVTLNFKTIEAARQALLDIPASALVGGPAPEEVELPKPVRAAKPAPEPVAAPVIATPVEAPVQAAAPAAVDYPTLQKAVLALAGKSRDAAAAIAASFGVKTFKELAQDKWADALEAVNERLAILEA